MTARQGAQPVGFLVDTNVVSELRKGERADPGVRSWYDAAPAESLFLSALTIGELRRGILSIARRDPAQAAILEAWLDRLLATSADRIVPVDRRVALAWAPLMVPDPRPVIDALLAATAIVNDLALVTRNVADFGGLGVTVVNPFSRASGH